MNEEKTKSFAVSKQMVYESYLKVCSKDGGAGIDKETIEMFNTDLSKQPVQSLEPHVIGQLFSTGRTHCINSKEAGRYTTIRYSHGRRPYCTRCGKRLSGTNLLNHCFMSVRLVTVRVAVHMMHLAQCQHNCIHYSWVVDLDIKGFFDNISHEWMMKMVSHHTQEKWVLLYTERWLKAGIEQADGSIAARTKGTPQGGVISPLLANLYLHHAFDMWMSRHFASNPFERYADDIIVHCNSKAEAEHLLFSIRQRLQGFELGITSGENEAGVLQKLSA